MNISTLSRTLFMKMLKIIISSKHNNLDNGHIKFNLIWHILDNPFVVKHEKIMNNFIHIKLYLLYHWMLPEKQTEKKPIMSLSTKISLTHLCIVSINATLFGFLVAYNNALFTLYSFYSIILWKIFLEKNLA